MPDLEKQLAKDRAQRDAAWTLCKADVGFIREDLEARSLGTRIGGRVKEGAMELADEAVQYTEENPYIVMGGAAAAFLVLTSGSLFGSSDD